MGDALPVRPAPIGAFALPFGYLLLPASADAAREALLAGRLPAEWPDELADHRAALESGALTGLFPGADAVSRYNRFVLDPSAVDVDALRADLGAFGVLVDVVRYGVGLTDTPPEADGTDGELRALVLATRAAEPLHAGDAATAVDLLREAIASAAVYPALAGVLHGALAEALRGAGDLAGAVTALQAGTRLLAGTDLRVACAEQHLELASCFHELAGDQRHLLTQAVNHYHCALQLVDLASAPELYAAAHANLATAYLTMPMVEASDQLRLGVAVGSLRAALSVYTPEQYPAQWSSAQLNLANALVYAPSTHREDNLAEAVELYEAVLQVRDRDTDPLGYARVLANQGNALAHLGMFEPARAKLVEARYLFEELGELDATHSVRGLLDEIARTLVAAP